MLGYVTRYKNETVARLMDCGKKFIAIVDEPRESEKKMNYSMAPTERGILKEVSGVSGGKLWRNFNKGG